MNQNKHPMGIRSAFNGVVIVAALGYFVDIYDLILFGVIRVPSLESLGYSGNALTDMGILLNNWQMGGMLLGGILWGVMGDRLGRRQVLFGSILMYSIANIANGFVGEFGDQAILVYKALRFIAGLGLAGELGAGITLISESMRKEDRGYGTMIMVLVGTLGGATAATVGNAFPWQMAYFIGGGMGLLLLLLRIYTHESGMFEHVKNEKQVQRGNFASLFTQRNRFLKFMACIGMGVPLWFTVGILMLMAKEFAPIIGVQGAEAKTIGGFALFWLYIGISVGDVVAGLLSQWWQSRRKVVLLFVLGHAISILIYLLVRDISFTTYKVIVFSLGLTSGFWGLFATIASEQFGTNIRATVATTVPNFVRGCIIPITILFSMLRDNWGGSANQQAMVNSALVVGSICIAISLLSLWSLPETFGKDLDYVEE